MTTQSQTEALKLALEALEGLKSLYRGNGHKLHEINMIHRKHDAAIYVIKEVLQSNEQVDCSIGMVAKDGRTILFHDNEFQRIEPFTEVYTHPPVFTAQPKKES